ncbi:MAG: hypothetical protein PHW60_16445 [Kiritimatiellae bacterium]|nr:hypothetical protein [Kiritimatiellia bacterium]
MNQTIFDFTPKAGEIWVAWGEIVMITRVGSENWNGIMPDCLEFIGLGYAEYDGPGRWWEVDYDAPSYAFERNRMDDGPRRYDKCYFKSWTGKGVFFCTADGHKAMILLSRWRKEINALHTRKEKHPGRVFSRDKVEEIETRLKRLFSKQIAPEGFL